jgi:putative spermidine/putrescine transport system permease protein
VTEAPANISAVYGGGSASVGRDLLASHRKAERRRRLYAVGLVTPLFLFIVLTFVTPIAMMLTRSIQSTEILETLPNTLGALKGWDGQSVPDEAVFAALATDLAAAHAARTSAQLGTRINREISGARSKIVATARSLASKSAAPYKDTIPAIEPIWNTTEIWSVIARGSSPYTDHYLLAALDLRRDGQGHVASVPPDQAIFLNVFARTFSMSAMVTVATLLLGYPLAYLIASAPARIGNVLMILVLLSFWTSILVRTTAWVVLLQTNGIINDALLFLGLTTERLQLIFSRFGTILAMTQIQLPFTLLPIYSVMRTISPNLMRAARSLGAGPITAFRRVYLPQTLPGVAAGCLLTFILCLGYYITPALVGGPTDQMVSSYIALYVNRELNWSMAAALGVYLLAATLGLYALYARIVGISSMKLG